MTKFTTILAAVVATFLAVASSTRATSTLTTLVNFNNVNGLNPQAGLIADSSGNLYGTTTEGGTVGDGTVFELSGANHLTLTTLANFSGGNGSLPECILHADPAGNLYGTTLYGGTNNDGTVFELSGTNHQTLTTLANFNGANGQKPFGGLVSDAAGNLYGTTDLGGADGDGTIFELSGANYQTLTTLVTFNGANGSNPQAGLMIDSAGNLYGTTNAGGNNNDGTVFELTLPEPTSLSLLFLAVPTLTARRRNRLSRSAFSVSRS
jgi:uncharacterized repeat protein (TIGR03803 family)